MIYALNLSIQVVRQEGEQKSRDDSRSCPNLAVEGEMWVGWICLYLQETEHMPAAAHLDRKARGALESGEKAERVDLVIVRVFEVEQLSQRFLGHGHS